MLAALFGALSAQEQTNINGGTTIDVPGNQSSPWNITGVLNVGF
jgi:hypothetical protein